MMGCVRGNRSPDRKGTMTTNPEATEATDTEGALAALIIRDAIADAAADAVLTHNIGARFAAERSGRGADGWERF